ncbi:protein of unknown function [Actinopolymorpha cephalotaxi]|uniref:DUF349 domain-containing protein n=1 Tax=Actinopolymorpha cephalotaxi TaxID=504797 RepID=A0A1I2Q158_9ACTN|nr:DUF349 domain-containing protein [Actinopolymorpha cephalotaxi]NYH83477.1 hypothetical protein [Actinopolymorpha cephalotaxi]SFG19371.1 protein of unknown function [Actinopolymorpha cephalotaxi]
MSGTAEEPWGRVADDGTVYLRTDEGERAIGSWQVGDPEGALAFFRRKYDALALEVDLLASRVDSGILAPDDAHNALRRERRNLAGAQAIGDLGALSAKLDRLEEVIAGRRAERRTERKRQLEEARTAKAAIADEAETLAAGSDWRHGVGRFRELLEQWKALPRLDKQTDDELWRRFSSARTSYTRRRKQHFSELNVRRDDARQTKEALAAEAEALADSTDWGRGSTQFRTLMQRWKAAGPAARDVEDQLWKRFRAAQDRFFNARNATFAEQDAEYRTNLEQKEALLVEAEALLPVRDHRAAREAYRSLLARWDQIGRVPRDSVRPVEGRLRKVEEAIKSAESNEWRRTNPETRARANDTLTQLRNSIADLERDLEAQQAKGDVTGERRAQEALDARRAWLAEVEKTLDEFSG